MPSQCIKRTSFLIPKRTSPWIALVGNKTEWRNNDTKEILDRLVSYFQALRTTEADGNPSLEYFLPRYRKQEFDNETQFYDYIASEDYNTDRLHKAGVCFGVGINKTKDENKYQIKLYFNDQSYLASRFAYGIPSQREPIWSPYQAAPLFGDAARYTKNAYSVVQNLIVWLLMNQLTGNYESQVSMMM